MHRLIFVNLPVADLERSRAFFTGLGYRFAEEFCDEQALALQLGPQMFAMLLRRGYFSAFHTGATAAPGTVETLLCLSADTRQQVDDVVGRAILLGGTDGRTLDLGATYCRSYADPDGHVWEVMWMEQRR